LYDQLEQAMSEAEKARWDVYQETVRRRKAEKDVIDALRKVTNRGHFLFSLSLAQSIVEGKREISLYYCD
jgi:hypothetical protein